jgi:ketosteroid isomerase-like protein
MRPPSVSSWKRSARRFERWYQSGQSDSLAQLYAADGMIFNPNGPPVAGRDAIGLI